MKPTTTNFDTEKNKETGAALRTLLEIDAPGGTLFFSDQDLTVSAQDYTGVVLSWGQFVAQALQGEEVQRFSEMSLSLSNNPRIDDQIDVGQEVRVYIWFSGLVSADKLLIYKGVVSDDISWDILEISFSTIDIGDVRNKMIGTPLAFADFPNADPDDAGKIQPIGYGSLVDHRCLAIDAGGLSTLREDLAAGGTTIKLTDASRFPTSGTLVIGDEDDITYSGKTSNDLTGVANVSQNYAKGTVVFENKSVKYMVLGHPGKAITNPRIWPFGHNKSQAVSIDPADFSVNLNDAGKATITLTDIPGIKKKVSIAVTQQPDQPITTQSDQPITTQSDQPITTQPDQPITTQSDQPVTQQPDYDMNTPDHAHDTNQLTSRSLVGTGDSGDFTNKSNARDENAQTFASGATVFGDNIKNIIINGFDTTDRGTIVSAKAVIKRTSFSSVGSYSANISAPSTGWSQSLAQATTPQEQKFETSLTNWSDLNDLQFQIIGGLGASDQVLASCYEMYWEVEYTPDIDTTFLDTDQNVNAVTTLTTDAVSNRITNAVSNRITNAVSNRITNAVTTRTVDVVIGGNSVADALSGVLIVDAEGYEDTGAGHYTGTPNALIEKPWDVIHHLLENFGNGITDADIDLAGSFTDTASSLPSTYKFGFTIINRISLNRLLAALSIQTFCRFFWDAGLAKLVEIKTEGTALKTLDLDDDSVMSANNIPTVRIDRVGLSAIYNDIEVLYNLDTTLGGWSDNNAYSLRSSDSDSGSVSTYGSRTKTWRFFAVRDTTHADDVRAKLLDYFRFPYKTLSFTTFLAHVELERGDLVKATWDKLGFEGKFHEVAGLNYAPPGNSFPELQYSLRSLELSEFTKTDIVTVTDILSKFVTSYSDVIAASDTLSRLGIGFTENVTISESLVTDITMEETEPVTVSDSLGFVHSAFYYDSVLFFDSTRFFNDTP